VGSGSDSRLVKRDICSNLPYGAHKVKFLRNGSEEPTFVDFIIYNTKKPNIAKELPILADYNIATDFVANTVRDTTTLSTGVVRKMNTREFAYTGTWSTNGQFPTSEISGINIFSTNTGNYCEYTFTGTGFDFRFDGDATMTFTLDGNSDFSAYTTSHYGAGVWTPASGTVVGNLDPSSGLVVSGIPFGTYTLRFTLTSGTIITPESMDVIMPIHAHNTSIGSLSLSDERKTEINSRSFITMNTIDSQLTNGFSSKNISQVLEIGTGFHDIYYESVYENIEYNQVSASQAVQRFSGTPTNYKARTATTNTSNTGVDSLDTQLVTNGDKQKDIFKD